MTQNRVRAILVVLFVGPPIAPLFQATRLPLVADTGTLARDLLSHYICPTPAKSYMLLGFPMAVCARCWGATIGLWAAWLAFQATNDEGRPRKAWIGHVVVRLLRSYLRLHWILQLAMSVLPFWLWAAEITWWPTAPYWLLLLNGAFAGLWAGLFFGSIRSGIISASQDLSE